MAAGGSGAAQAVAQMCGQLIQPVSYLAKLNPYVAESLVGQPPTACIPRQAAPFALHKVQTVYGVSSFDYQGTNAHLLFIKVENHCSWAASTGLAKVLWRRQEPSHITVSHKLLQAAVIVPARHMVSIQCSLGCTSLAYLADYKIGGQNVMPFAALMEMSLAAGIASIQPGDPREHVVLSKAAMTSLALCYCHTKTALTCTCLFEKGSLSIEFEDKAAPSAQVMTGQWSK